MISVGIVLGVAGATAAAHVLRKTVEGMQPADPATFAVTLFVLTIAALVASFLPARRASRVDPMTVLRQD
jgi:putative ABC transport system permease protein